ncbi:MAG TPA: helix-turn-helix domain-containing protein [Pseudonocardiaceae bacterium]|nr:helix-turn-helix domain-containing protein [Pseudonocardiaceae bacterium]
MQVEGSRLYRARVVAEMLDVSPATIYRAVDSGALPAVRIGVGKGAVRIPGDGLAKYLAECRRAAVTPNGLSDAQADGRACVICGADFPAVQAASYPVGRSLAGSQVFACTTHRDDVDGVDGASETLAEAA